MILINDEEAETIAGFLPDTKISKRLKRVLKDNLKNKKIYSAYRKQAKVLFHEEGSTEVDDEAVVSMADKRPDGAYVQAWVWVPKLTQPEIERLFKNG